MVAQLLLRHSKADLTLSIYSHLGLVDLQSGLDAMPKPPVPGKEPPQQARATGTEGPAVLASCLALSDRKSETGIDRRNNSPTVSLPGGSNEKPLIRSESAANQGSSTERTGFEPVMECYPHTGLANRRYRPLSHLSRANLQAISCFFLGTS